MYLSRSIAAALFVVTGSVSLAEDKKEAKEVASKTVQMQDDKFVPVKIEIKVGDSVVWENKGCNTHTATADDKTFDTKDVAPGKSSAPVKFTKAGEYKYYCIHHGKPGGVGMSGTVIVKE